MNPEPIAPSAASLSTEFGSSPASCRNVADAKNMNPTQSIMDDHEKESVVDLISLKPIVPSTASISTEYCIISAEELFKVTTAVPKQSIMDEDEINRAAQDAALKILPEVAKRIHSPWPELMQLLVDTFKQGVDFALNTYKPSN